MYTMTAATIDSKERTIKRIITIKIKENMTNNLCISNELMKRKRKKKKNYSEKKTHNKMVNSTILTPIQTLYFLLTERQQLKRTHKHTCRRKIKPSKNNTRSFRLENWIWLKKKKTTKTRHNKAKIVTFDKLRETLFPSNFELIHFVSHEIGSGFY